jgi:hypothetical protein
MTPNIRKGLIPRRGHDLNGQAFDRPRRRCHWLVQRGQSMIDLNGVTGRRHDEARPPMNGIRPWRGTSRLDKAMHSG